MSENQKKLLAKQIKEDLQKDLEEAKKEEKSKNGFGGCSWLIAMGEDCGSYRGNERRLIYYGSDNDKWKEKQHPGAREGIYVFPEELEPNDWKEIEGLIQQVRELEKKKQEKEDQKYREEQAQIDSKLNHNSKLFLYQGGGEWAVDYDPRGYDKFRVFRGIQNGQKFDLAFPENYPLAVNLNQKGTFFQIEGVENIPFQPEKKNNQLPWKKVNLNDKITITEFKENSEEEQPTKNNPIDKLANPLPKELNNENLLQYFQKNNIKSIKLDNNELVVKYKNKQEKETKKINDQELEQIKSFVEKLGKSELFLSDLESSSNTNSPNNKSNKGLYISLAVVGVLVAGIVAWLLVRNKKVKKASR